MVVSLILSIFFPIKTFLLVFVILGPLHYLTEINWLEGKNYFSNHKNQFRVITVLAALVYMVPIVIQFEWVRIRFFNQLSEVFLGRMSIYTNGLILGIIGLAIGFVISRKRYLGILLMIVLGSTVFFLWKSDVFLTWTAVFLPTIVHVYLFTTIFMLFGSLKSESKLGYFNVVLLVLVPFIIDQINFDTIHYHFSDWSKQLFIDNKFHILNAKLSEFLGLSDGQSFFFYEVMDLKIQCFIAFAYTFHYLNWFTKTTVINWHKDLSVKRTVLIGVIWFIILVLFYFDFRLGFLFASFFSILHVFQELPLNITSIKGVIGKLFTSD